MNHNTSTVVLVAGQELHYHWRGELIFASFIVSYLGCATALLLMKQRTGTSGRKNVVYLVAGSVATGVIGIFNMHFVGMQALQLRTDTEQLLPVVFSVGLTVASCIIAFCIILVGFWVAGDPSGTIGASKIVATGLVGGAGVSAMHYCGQLAMVMQADAHFSAGIVVASVVIGVTAVTAALWIFFRLAPQYNHHWALIACAAFVMACAILSMHYTGMYAASYTVARDPVDTSGYAEGETITVMIVALSVVWAVLVIAWSLWRYRRLWERERQKGQALTLGALVFNADRTKLLATELHTLPCEVIEAQYVGVGVFDQRNADFVRMFKTSFAWSQAEHFLQKYSELHDKGDLKSSQFRLYLQFIEAAKRMAAALGVELGALGALHWQPVNHSMVLLVITHGSAAAATASSSTTLTTALQHQFRWVKTPQLLPGLQLLLNDGCDPAEWLDEVLEVNRKCLLPLTGEQRGTEKLDELLRDVALEVLPYNSTQERDSHVKQWQKHLVYVNTPQDLLQLSKHPTHWTAVPLSPMIKVKLETYLQQKSDNLQLRLEDSVSTLYLGLYYIQIKADTPNVLVLSAGPWSMVPLARFSRQQQLQAFELVWLQRLVSLEHPELQHASLVHSFEQIVQYERQQYFVKQAHNISNAGGRIGNVATIDVATTAVIRTTSSTLAVPPEPTMSHGRDDEYKLLQPFIADFYQTCVALANTVGTGRDLTLNTLKGLHLLPIATDLTVLLFVVKRMSGTVPHDYDLTRLTAVPLKLFKVLHTAQPRRNRHCREWIYDLVLPKRELSDVSPPEEAAHALLHANHTDDANNHHVNNNATQQHPATITTYTNTLQNKAIDTPIALRFDIASSADFITPGDSIATSEEAPLTLSYAGPSDELRSREINMELALKRDGLPLYNNNNNNNPLLASLAQQRRCTTTTTVAVGGSSIGCAHTNTARRKTYANSLRTSPLTSFSATLSPTNASVIPPKLSILVHPPAAP